jgi:Xaa-Pro aminopeptidase
MATDILADDRALRLGRRERVLAEMEAHQLDLLILGRQANVRYATGAQQLWVAGTRPFGPACVVVRETAEIHLLSTWDEGVPDDIPHSHLYGITWNPMNLVARLQQIHGAGTAHKVGTDSLSPLFGLLLPMAFPNAELVDGDSAMRSARRIKTPEEVVAMRNAVRVAEDGLAASVAELQPGATEQTLIGVLLETMTAGGVTTPATQDAAWVTAPDHPWRRLDRNRPVEAGDLVAFTSGVLADGYIGEVGRTWPAGEARAGARELYATADELRSRLLAVCRPGAHAAEFLTAYESFGLPLPPMPVAHGLGLGFDPPVVSPQLPQTAAAEILQPGMVLAVTTYIWQQGVGAVFDREAVLITEDGSEVLTTSPSWRG